jgi:DNA-binding Xre family transcriptional regulator
LTKYGFCKVAIVISVSYAKGRSFYSLELLNDRIQSFVKSKMGLIRLRIREFADEKGWTLKDVADRSGVAYSSVRAYARAPGLAMVDFTSLLKMARALDVMLEELVEVVED